MSTCVACCFETAAQAAADIDAVTGAPHPRNHPSPRTVSSSLSSHLTDASRWRLGDPDGLQDLDPSRLRASFQGLQVSPFAVLPSMQITQLDAQSVTPAVADSPAF